MPNPSQKSYSRFVLFCFGGGGNGPENHLKMTLGETKNNGTYKVLMFSQLLWCDRGTTFVMLVDLSCSNDFL